MGRGAQDTILGGKGSFETTKPQKVVHIVVVKLLWSSESATIVNGAVAGYVDATTYSR